MLQFQAKKDLSHAQLYWSMTLFTLGLIKIRILVHCHHCFS
jgi:hypothetical protein